MNKNININDILNGVGKRLRTSFLAGKVSEANLQNVYSKNKREADAFDGFGWSFFDFVQEEKRIHNPLLRTKLQHMIEDHKQKSRCSSNLNALSLSKLKFYYSTALGIGLRPIIKYLRKIAKGGNVQAERLATLFDIEFANLYAK